MSTIRPETIDIWKDEEYSYPHAFGFRPGMHAYLHPEDEGGSRPVMIVVPGGAYKNVCPSESWSVGHKFHDAGYNVFILSYTTNYFLKAPLMDLPRRELARAVRLIRSRADELHCDPGRIALCGFSAGGHLVGSLLVHHKDTRDPDEELDRISARPDAVILSYPVICSGSLGHRESIQALLGRDIYDRDDEESRRLLEYNSLEKWVEADTAPVFLWHTVTDELVPVENSIIFEAALREKGVPHAMHLYSEGQHGLSSADEEWILRRSDDLWCTDQTGRLLDAVRRGEISVTEEEFREAEENYLDYVNRGPMPRKGSEEVSNWCAEAIAFLHHIWEASDTINAK